MNIHLAGISFTIKDNPKVSDLKPEGSLTVIPEPENKYDKKAKRVEFNGVKLGYLPSGIDYDKPTISIKQVFYWEDKMTGIEFDFDPDEKLEQLPFNLEYDVKNHIYYRDGKKLLSASKLAGLLPSDTDRLIRWAMDFKTYDDYKEALQGYADRGTKVHEICEKALEGNVPSDHPIKNFIDKFKPKLISKEEVVYDEAISVIGRYDALVEIGSKDGESKKILIDWKNGLYRKKYNVQIAFYAHCLKADEAWVVSFKSKTKQGYTISKVKDIEKWYNIGVNLSKNYYLMN